MKTYPVELRQKIIDAVDQQLGTYKEIAEMFGIAERYIYKLLDQRRKTGSLAPLPRGGGAAAKLDEEHLLTLAELVARQPDATLKELGRQLQRKTNKRVSLSTVWRGLERIEFTQKKDPLGARG
jgi:transposase